MPTAIPFLHIPPNHLLAPNYRISILASESVVCVCVCACACLSECIAQSNVALCTATGAGKQISCLRGDGEVTVMNKEYSIKQKWSVTDSVHKKILILSIKIILKTFLYQLFSDKVLVG